MKSKPISIIQQSLISVLHNLNKKVNFYEILSIAFITTMHIYLIYSYFSIPHGFTQEKTTHTLSTGGVVFLTFIRLPHFNVYEGFQYTS